MMADTKGRGGKKPKYQIADIGGADPTSEDISTERVLNFLIKGEMGGGEQGVPQAGSTGAEKTAAPSAPPSARQVSPPEEAPAEQPVKKSLDHLFQRAGSGAGGPAKDLKLKLSEPAEEVAVSVPSPQPPPQPPPETEGIARASREETGREAEVVEPPPQPPVAPPPATALGKSAVAEFDLALYVDLWKNFYRLKAGEIEALSTLFRMSHGEGRSECHVKMRKLAEMSNLDYRYCQKVVRSLERLGWITKLQDYDPATQLGVLYRVNLKPAQAI